MMERRRCRLGLLLVTAAAFFTANNHARAESTAEARINKVPGSSHELEPGDVLELTVVGLPDLRQRLVVGLDGYVQINLAGAIAATGRSYTDLRNRIGAALSQKVLKQRAPDGHEIVVTIEPDDVTLTMMEYRPIYVAGDVAKPGEIPFRAGMSVGQAVTLAGGFDTMRFRAGNPFLDSADMKSEYDTLWSDIVREQARIARINAELQGRSDLSGLEIQGTPLRSAVVQQIIRLETEQLKVHNADYQKERDFFERAAAQAETHLTVLTDQQKNEKEGADLDVSDYERIRDLFQRGAVPITRLTDARRSMLLSSTRMLQTQVQIEQVKKDREDARRGVQRVTDKHQMDLTQDLQNSLSKISTARNRLEAIEEKLTYVGLIKSQLVRGRGAQPDLKISRRGAAGRTRLAAQDDTELMPGDVIEVTLSEVKPTEQVEDRFQGGSVSTSSAQPGRSSDSTKNSPGGTASTLARNEPKLVAPIEPSSGRKSQGQVKLGPGIGGADDHAITRR
jgi:polysaccharide export outer membrane protein